jgi:hypothetical protein
MRDQGECDRWQREGHHVDQSDARSLCSNPKHVDRVHFEPIFPISPSLSLFTDYSAFINSHLVLATLLKGVSGRLHE